MRMRDEETTRMWDKDEGKDEDEDNERRGTRR